MSCEVNIAGKKFSTEEIIESHLGSPLRFDDVILLAEESGDFIAGVPIRHQIDAAEVLISYMLREINIFNTSKDGVQTLNKKELFEQFDKHKKTLFEIYDKAVRYGDKDVASEKFKKIGQYSKAMMDNFDVIESLAMRVLINKGIFSLAKGNIDSLIDSMQENNLRNFDEDFQFERDLKDNMSTRLKYFFAQIYSDRKNMNNIAMFMDMDEVYVTVRTVLSGVYPDYNEMKEILVEEAKTKPWLQEVVDRLDSDESIRNEFVTNMTSHPVAMTFLNPEKEKGRIKWKITESNRNTGGRIVSTNWMDSMMHYPNLYYQDPQDDKYRIIDSNNPEGSAIIKKLVEKYTDIAPTKANMQSFFKDIGITLSDAAVDYIEANGFTVGNTKYTLASFMSSRNENYGVGRILSGFKELANRKAAFEDKNIFDTIFSGSLLRGVAEIEFKVSKNIPIPSFRSKDHSITAHVLNRYATNRVRDLVTSQELRNELANMPFNGKSTILKLLNDPILQKDFKLEYPDIGQLLGGEYAKPLNKLTPEDHVLASMIYHQNNGYILNGEKGGKYRSIKMFYPTMSDKKNKYILSTPMDIINEYDFFTKEGGLEDGVLSYLVEALIMPEFNRILAEQKRESRNISGYDTGRSMFFVFPEMNNMKELFWMDGEKRMLKDFDTISEEGLKTIKEMISDSVMNEFYEIKTKYREVFSKNMNTEYEAMLESYGQKDNLVDTSIMDFILSSLVVNMNVMQLISGDPAMMFKANVYETWDNYAKRWAKDNAPGMEIDDTNTSKDKSVVIRNKYNVLFVNDEFAGSDYESHFKSLDAEEGYEDGGMNTADAQAYMSLKEWAHIVYRKGDISKDEYNTLMRAYSDDSNLPKELLTRITNVFKPVIVSDKRLDGVEQKIYIKMSVFPLIPELTKGTELDQVRLKMKKDRGDKKDESKHVDLVVFKSAAKIGAPLTLENLFSEGETYSEDSIIQLDRYGFRLQQEIPQKTDNFINRGTQFTKLIFNSIRHIKGISELEAQYDKLYAELYNKKQEDLKKEILLEDGSLNFAKFNDLIKQELIDRKYDMQTLKYFAKIVENGRENFAYPFWNTPQKKRIEPVINALIDSRIRKTKFPGKSYVLAARTGFKTRALTLEDYQKTGGGLVFTPTYEFGSHLKPQVFNSKTQQRAQVIVPWNFRDDTGKLLPMKNYMTDGKIDFAKIPQELLQIQGFRIPTQGLNSMSAIEIVGFLPEGVTDLIIAPAEYVTQMGSDFDVDKLYTYQKSYSVSGRQLKVTTREESLELGIMNEILDIHDAVLTNPHKDVQKAIVKKLDYGLFDTKNFFEEIGIGDSKKNKVFILPTQQMSNYIGASSAKSAVGAYSLASTFNALIQDPTDNKQLELIWEKDPLNLYGSDENYNTVLRTFGKLKASNNLSDINSIRGERTKADIISAIQSAAVDNENKRILERIGINRYTVGIPPAMAQLGLEEDFIATLLRLSEDHSKALKEKDKDFAKYIIDLIIPQVRDKAKREYESGTYPDNFSYDDVLNIEIDKYKKTIKEVMTGDIEDYKDVLKGKNIPNTEAYKIAALYQLYSFNNLGNQLSDYNKLLNLDSAGLEKNFLDAMVYDTKFQNLLQSNDPILPFIGNLVTSEAEGGIYQIDDKTWFEPTKISSIMYFNESKFIVDTLYSDDRFTVYNTPAFKRMRNELLSLHFDKRPSDIRMNELLEFYESYLDVIESSLFKFMMSNYEPLYPRGLINFNLTKESIEDQVRKLKHSKAAKGNKFLALLENGLDGKIIYRASRKTDDFSTEITDHFLDLIRNNRYLEEIGRDSKDFAYDLIRYNFSEDPYQKATNFSRYISFDVLNSMGIPQSLREFDFNDEATLGYNPLQISTFVRQFVQNYPSVVPDFTERVEFEPGKSIQKTLKFIGGDQVLNPQTSRIIRLDDVLYESNGFEFVALPNLYNEYDITKSVITNSVVKPQKESEYINKIYSPTFPKVTSSYTSKITKAITNSDVPGILTLIKDNSSNVEYQQLAAAMLNSKGIEDVLLSFANVPIGRTSYLTDFNLVQINRQDFGFRNVDVKEKIILHELVHAFTKKAIVLYNNKKDLNPEQQKAMDRLSSLFEFFKTKTINPKELKAFEDAKDKAKKDGEPFNPSEFQVDVLYAATNLEEFMAILLTSETLQNHLKESVAGKTSLWEKIKEALFDILKAFGLIDVNSDQLVKMAMEDVITVIKTNDDLIVPDMPKSNIFASIKDISPNNPLLDVC
jgi:hypothetical protein